jgi:hypothetical protein
MAPYSQSTVTATKNPSLEKNVNWENLCTYHLEPERTTQCLDLGERVKPNMLGIIPPDNPLECFPGKGKPTKYIVFYYHLPRWSQQAFESSKDCFRILEIMKGIGAGNQVKEGRWIGKASPFLAA